MTLLQKLILVLLSIGGVLTAFGEEGGTCTSCLPQCENPIARVMASDRIVRFLRDGIAADLIAQEDRRVAGPYEAGVEERIPALIGDFVDLDDLEQQLTQALDTSGPFLSLGVTEGEDGRVVDSRRRLPVSMGLDIQTRVIDNPFLISALQEPPVAMSTAEARSFLREAMFDPAKYQRLQAHLVRSESLTPHELRLVTGQSDSQIAKNQQSLRALMMAEPDLSERAAQDLIMERSLSIFGGESREVAFGLTLAPGDGADIDLSNLRCERTECPSQSSCEQFVVCTVDYAVRRLDIDASYTGTLLDEQGRDERDYMGGRFRLGMRPNSDGEAISGQVRVILNADGSVSSPRLSGSMDPQGFSIDVPPGSLELGLQRQDSGQSLGVGVYRGYARAYESFFRDHQDPLGIPDNFYRDMNRGRGILLERIYGEGATWQTHGEQAMQHPQFVVTYQRFLSRMYQERLVGVVDEDLLRRYTSGVVPRGNTLSEYIQQFTIHELSKEGSPFPNGRSVTAYLAAQRVFSQLSGDEVFQINTEIDRGWDREAGEAYSVVRRSPNLSITSFLESHLSQVLPGRIEPLITEQLQARLADPAIQQQISAGIADSTQQAVEAEMEVRARAAIDGQVYTVRPEPPGDIQDMADRGVLFAQLAAYDEQMAQILEGGLTLDEVKDFASAQRNHFLCNFRGNSDLEMQRQLQAREQRWSELASGHPGEIGRVIRDQIIAGEAPRRLDPDRYDTRRSCQRAGFRWSVGSCADPDDVPGSVERPVNGGLAGMAQAIGDGHTQLQTFEIEAQLAYLNSSGGLLNVFQRSGQCFDQELDIGFLESSVAQEDCDLGIQAGVGSINGYLAHYFARNTQGERNCDGVATEDQTSVAAQGYVTACINDHSPTAAGGFPSARTCGCAGDRAYQALQNGCREVYGGLLDGSSGFSRGVVSQPPEVAVNNDGTLSLVIQNFRFGSIVGDGECEGRSEVRFSIEPCETAEENRQTLFGVCPRVVGSAQFTQREGAICQLADASQHIYTAMAADYSRAIMRQAIKDIVSSSLQNSYSPSQLEQVGGVEGLNQRLRFTRSRGQNNSAVLCFNDTTIDSAISLASVDECTNTPGQAPRCAPGPRRRPAQADQ